MPDLRAERYRALTPVAQGGGGRILVVDNDHDIAEVVEAILYDAGFSVVLLTEYDSARIQHVVENFAPECVLLDGQGPGNYGASWQSAAWLSVRQVPTIMFTADAPAAFEAQHRMSERSREAQFSGVVTKPFDIDALIDMILGVITRRSSASRS